MQIQWMRFGTQDEDIHYWFNFKNRKLYTDPQYKHILHLELEVRLHSAAIFLLLRLYPFCRRALTTKPRTGTCGANRRAAERRPPEEGGGGTQVAFEEGHRKILCFGLAQVLAQVDFCGREFGKYSRIFMKRQD